MTRHDRFTDAVVALFGHAKVAYEVMRARGEYVPRDASAREHVLSLTLKVAQNRVAQAKIRRGLAAYRRVTA